MKQDVLLLGLPSTADALILALREMRPGDEVVYFRGHIYEASKYGEASRVITEAHLLSSEGKVHLVQKRPGKPMKDGIVDYVNGTSPLEFIAQAKKFKRTK